MEQHSAPPGKKCHTNTPPHLEQRLSLCLLAQVVVHQPQQQRAHKATQRVLLQAAGQAVGVEDVHERVERIPAGGHTQRKTQSATQTTKWVQSSLKGEILPCWRWPSHCNTQS